MAKQIHEFRDPIHTFIRISTRERNQIVDTRPLQRLRNIHQLALTYLVYPGATHRRFEHSLGVLELADRVFSVVSNPEHRIGGLADDITDFFFGESTDNRTDRENWRRVLRMAALCHDVGHFPFSHAGEDLGPTDPLHPSDHVTMNHERLTLNLIRSEHLAPALADMAPNGIERTARLAVGQKDFVGSDGIKLNPSNNFSNIEAILSEIITGNAFGVDRMDYLLRDSHHAGVAYGHFDHFRLIDTLRILPKPLEDAESDSTGSREPGLGVEEGGLQSAEQLLLARHFMYSQMYFHPVRRAFDIHLKDFLKGWLTNGTFPLQNEEHLLLDDSAVLRAMNYAVYGGNPEGLDEATVDAARRIVERKHFKVAWSRNDLDIGRNLDAARLIYEALKSNPQYGPTKVRIDRYSAKANGRKDDFPVLLRDDTVVWASAKSRVIALLPPLAIEYVFVAPEVRDQASRWIQDHKKDILAEIPGEERQ